MINLRIKNLCWEKFLFLEIRNISNNINARYSIYYFCATLGLGKTLSRPTPINFNDVFCKFWNITYSCKTNMKIYSFFSWWIRSLKKVTNYRIDAIFDSGTKCSKFGSETTTAWLFLSYYVSVNIFFWLYYISKYIN